MSETKGYKNKMEKTKRDCYITSIFTSIFLGALSVNVYLLIVSILNKKIYSILLKLKEEFIGSSNIYGFKEMMNIILIYFPFIIFYIVIPILVFKIAFIYGKKFLGKE